MKIDDAIMFFEKAAEASARLGTEKLDLGVIAHIAYATYSQIAEWLKELKQRRTIDAVEWIPCSERLPSENEEVLVCDKDGTMEVCDLETFGRGVGLKWTDKNGYECWLDVIAWMPLPKPYGESKGE